MKKKKSKLSQCAATLGRRGASVRWSKKRKKR